MEYYPVPYKLDGKSRLLIHFQNDEDGVIVDGDNVMSFAASPLLEAFARKRKVKLQASRPVLDFDAMLAWLRKPTSDPDCPSLYAAWNLLGDVATALGEGVTYPGYGRRYQRLHEELLWGCNLPGAFNNGQPYIPELSDYEMDMLHEVLLAGLRPLRERVKVHE